MPNNLYRWLSLAYCYLFQPTCQNNLNSILQITIPLIKLNIKSTQRENKISGNVIVFHIPVFFYFKRMDLYLPFLQIKWTKWPIPSIKMCTREYIIADRNSGKLRGKTKFHPQVHITASLGGQARERKDRQRDDHSNLSQMACKSA